MQSSQKIDKWLPGDRKGEDELQKSRRKLEGSMTEIFIFLFLKIFYVDIFFKAFIEFVAILLLFYIFGFLAIRHVGS